MSEVVDSTAMSADPDPKAGHADIIRELRDRLEIARRSESDNRQEALDDLNFLSGEGQWDAQVRTQRELEGRPA